MDTLSSIGMSSPKHNPERGGSVPDVSYTLSMLVMPNNENTLDVMHGGWMMSWMDMAAWVVAARAVVSDQTVFFKAANDVVWQGPIHAGEVCNVHATLAAVGRTSLTIRLEATAEDPVAKATRPVCSGTFTMVAGQNGHAEPIRLHEHPTSK